ncbi:hypothetical protein K1T71_009567 [Dendrolimus kikuchii]|uniref:Uncharacterized protein n=1 Tax=Dendrolimus kikuchii TaxID=765133 RepID=A0ACC1CSS9_9NEOP|nr:hypothetical protein K1T71_009567 [Dendrolimus kikuchii]
MDLGLRGTAIASLEDLSLRRRSIPSTFLQCSSLDMFCNREYQLHLNLKEEPSIINLLAFLEKRAWAMEVSMARPIPAPEEHFVGIAPVGMSMATHATAQEGQRDTATCLYCKCQHKLFKYATFDIPSNIQILMAADVFFQIILPGKQHDSSVEHLANSSSNQHSSSSHFLNTKFGYVVAGTFSNISQSQYMQKKIVNLMCKSCDYEINKNLENFWKIEAVPEVFQEGNVESEQCENFFRETVELTNNKFQVSLPLKISLKYMNKMLGDSFHLALKRFHNTERKLQREPLLYNQYKAFIDEYVALGHGSYINIDKYDFTCDPVYFLPHHAVLRPDKKTTKCRVVFDASMLTSKSRCLNDLLLNGPTVQRDLIDILLLFRLGSYVFSTDLKSMFRCIGLKPEYRSLQLILWREAPSENIKCIELNTVTYGFKCSTFLATRCLLELALRYEKEYPIASFILRNQTYVDDILVSSMSIELLQEMKDQLINLLSLGGFQAHKWSSNCSDMLRDIPKEKQHFDDVDIQKENYFLKTLGVTYNTKTDSFKISCPEPHDTEPNTKRDILSYLARFYDPLGLAGPITVLAKVIIQKLWLAKLDWDSALPKDLHSIWMKFYSNLINMTPIYVNRNVTPQGTHSIQLIGFADAASSTAYGCCLYLRVSDEKETNFYKPRLPLTDFYKI